LEYLADVFEAATAAACGDDGGWGLQSGWPSDEGVEGWGAVAERDPQAAGVPSEGVDRVPGGGGDRCSAAMIQFRSACPVGSSW
jgi:hypothetical protein